MHEHVDRHSSQWMKWIQYPQCFGGAKTEYIFALADHSKGLKLKVRISRERETKKG